jgi:hypothetical protein
MIVERTIGAHAIGTKNRDPMGFSISPRRGRPEELASGLRVLKHEMAYCSDLGLLVKETNNLLRSNCIAGIESLADFKLWKLFTVL